MQSGAFSSHSTPIEALRSRMELNLQKRGHNKTGKIGSGKLGENCWPTMTLQNNPLAATVWGPLSEVFALCSRLISRQRYLRDLVQLQCNGNELKGRVKNKRREVTRDLSFSRPCRPRPAIYVTYALPFATPFCTPFSHKGYQLSSHKRSANYEPGRAQVDAP